MTVDQTTDVRSDEGREGVAREAVKEQPQPATNGIHRILYVALVALAGFAVAIMTLADEGRRGCVAEARRDPSYQAQMLGQPALGTTQHEIAVERNGEPVQGADVCANLSMVGMSAMGVRGTAEEVRPGVYQVSLLLEMSGEWRGNILITEPGRPRTSVPLRFSVT